jgi:hypothetical protein
MITARVPWPLAPATFRAWRWPMWPIRGAQRHISRRIVSLTGTELWRYERALGEAGLPFSSQDPG